MNDPKTGSVERPFRQTATIAAALALTAILIGTMVVIVAYTSDVAARADRRANELSAQIAALGQSQELMAARLKAQSPAMVASMAAAGTPPASDATTHTDGPFVLTAAEIRLGESVVVARLVKIGTPKPSGWPAAIHSGNYLEGTFGFDVAASHGEVFQGSYYVEESTRTVGVTLLRGAKVMAYGWAGSSASGLTPVSASELATALARDDATGRRWRNTWFWMKAGRKREILAAVQTPPQ